MADNGDENRLSRLLDAFDTQDAEVAAEKEVKQSEEDAFIDAFQVVATDVVNPYFDEVKAQLVARGHQAAVRYRRSEPGGGTHGKILAVELCFSPRGKTVAALGTSSTIQSPHVMVICEPKKQRIVTHEGTIGGMSGGSSGRQMIWMLEEVTRQAVEERTVAVMAGALVPAVRSSRPW